MMLYGKTQVSKLSPGIHAEIMRSVNDIEAVSMSRYIVKHDGLFLGSSSACNLVAAVRVAKTLPQGSRVVTIL